MMVNPIDRRSDLTRNLTQVSEVVPDVINLTENPGRVCVCVGVYLR